MASRTSSKKDGLGTDGGAVRKIEHLAGNVAHAAVLLPGFTAFDQECIFSKTAGI
jgi:hypothetical protein